MKDKNTELEKYRVTTGVCRSDSSYGMTGAFEIPSPVDNNILCIVADDGKESQWEHVSVSRRNRCPNWVEMCFIKDFFWGEEEIAIQYHPPKSKYINTHPFVLHLWRPKKKKIPLPPTILV